LLVLQSTVNRFDRRLQLEKQFADILRASAFIRRRQIPYQLPPLLNGLRSQVLQILDMSSH
jgi:hypothetical protein